MWDRDIKRLADSELESLDVKGRISGGRSGRGVESGSGVGIHGEVYCCDVCVFRLERGRMCGHLPGGPPVALSVRHFQALDRARVRHDELPLLEESSMRSPIVGAHEVERCPSTKEYSARPLLYSVCTKQHSDGGCCDRLCT
jgi:hypothetical protein